MTGRRLYEVVTDAVFAEQAYRHPSGGTGDSYLAREEGVIDGNFTGRTPAAWAFLPKNERDAWNAAAKRLSGRRRKA